MVHSEAGTRIGENITVIRELVNIGNQNIISYHWIPVMFTEAKYQNESHAWPDTYPEGFVLGGNPLRSETLKPNIPNSVNAPPVIFTLDSPGNYTILSMAFIKFDSNDIVGFHGIPLWSKPLQITILPEKYMQNETNTSIQKIPEFPFAIPILLISVISILAFYKMKSSFRM